MVVSELAIGLLTNALYGSIISVIHGEPSSNAYNKSIKRLNKKYNLSKIQIDSFLQQENVKVAIKEYLENPKNHESLKILTDEFISSFSKENFYREYANSILSTFFEELDAEIEKDPDLRALLQLYLTKKTYQSVRETHEVVKEINHVSQNTHELAQKLIKEVNEIHKEIKDTADIKDTSLIYAKNIYDSLSKSKNLVSYIDLKCDDEKKKVVTTNNNVEEAKNDVLIDKCVERWLTRNKYPILAILRDSGTGKTTYVKNLIKLYSNYYFKNYCSYLPLLVELKKFSGIQNLEDIFKNDFIMYGLNFHDYKDKFRNGRMLFVFDGLDELPIVSFKKFKEIYSLVSESEKHKVIITSRTHFFKNKEEEESSLKPESIDFTGILLKDETKVKTIYINLFKEDDIKKYLEKNFGESWLSKYEMIKKMYNLNDLSRRPMLLNLIVQTLSELLTTDDITKAKIYDKYTTLWMDREQWRDINPKYVMDIMGDLAFKMFDENKYVITLDELNGIIDQKFMAEKITIGKFDIEEYRRKIRSATFISRDLKDKFMFMHKSFMEFFIAKKFCNEINEGIKDRNSLGKIILTPEIIDFVMEMDIYDQ